MDILTCPAYGGEEDAVAEFFVRLSEGRVDEAVELLAPGLVTHDMPPGVPPGREGARQLFLMLKTAFPNLRFVIEDTVTEGNKIAVRLTARGCHEGAFLGIPATGKEVEYVLVEVLRLENGLIDERWGVADWLAVMQQLGAI